jgi:hypothetical protein
MRNLSTSSIFAIGGPIFAVAVAFFFGGTAGADQGSVPAETSQPSVDSCAIVALAKFKQWIQPMIMIDQTNTFADGSKRGMQLIVTENTAYARFNHLWKTAQVTRPQRGVGSPQMLAKHMGLATCAKGDAVQEPGGQVTAYTYSYTPDDNGTVSKGTLWISDATGLPVRQQFDQNGPLANSHVATTIESTYSYNTDVTVPRGAELAEDTRLFHNRLPFFYGQSAFADGAR